jgi:pilus assembly protein CpaC
MSLRRALLALIAVTVPSAASAPGAWAQPGLIGAPTHSYVGASNDNYGRENGETMRVDLSSDVTETRILALPKGKSAVIDLPTDARDVVVSDPKVADVVLSTPRRIYVLGVGGGQTDAAFFDASGRQLLRLNIRVDQDISALADTLNRVLPGSTIRAEAVNQSIVLSGEVASLAIADKAVRLAQGFTGKPDQVVNMLSIAESEQVMLKVRIVEVQRSIIKQLGVNLSALVANSGTTGLSLAQASTFGVNNTLVGGVTGTLTGTNSNKNGVTSAAATLKAFERVGLVRTLAEPNLTAVSGESAKFLVGGEYPVPSGRDSTGQVTIVFKQYGVGLGFTPVVLSKGRISLKLSTEVSEIDNSNTFTLTSSSTSTTASSSLVIPGLNVRRAETVVELPSGQSMMIAGLLESTNKSTLDSLPGLMQLPVLGALFRSRDYQQGETELVVIVTPYLVKPALPGQLQTPGDGLEMANDLEVNLLGKLNKSVGRTAPEGKTYQGPFGYVVE